MDHKSQCADARPWAHAFEKSEAEVGTRGPNRRASAQPPSRASLFSSIRVSDLHAQNL